MGLFSTKITITNVETSFSEEMEDYGLGKYVDKLYKIAKKAIQIAPFRIEEDSIPIGKSKIGGHPDIVPDFKWPTNNNIYLAFLAQINLKEISIYDSENLLPHKGILYFFYDSHNMPWGLDLQDRDCYRVVYYDVPLEKLVRIPYPVEITKQHDSIYKACGIKFKLKWSLPTYEEIRFNNDNYIDYVSLDDGKETYLLGYCKNIQEDVRLTCATVAHDAFIDGFNKLPKQLKKQIMDDKDEWVLLFQLDSIEACQMMWGDMGILYFMIKKEDLKERKFENCWLILQCY